MYANCGSRNARCPVYKVEIISLAFKRLIVLRSAKTKSAIKRVLKRVKTHVHASSEQAVEHGHGLTDFVLSSLLQVLSMRDYAADMQMLGLKQIDISPPSVRANEYSCKWAVSTIIPSAPKCSSRHFIFHRKYVRFE